MSGDGANVGDLCEIGNASILMPGARLGDRVFLGEGTLVPAGATLPDGVVVVGRPARVSYGLRRQADVERLRGLRDGDLRSPTTRPSPSSPNGDISMGQSIRHRVPCPRSPLRRSIRHGGDTGASRRRHGRSSGAGVKIIGDSHGPVRIGNDVQILENTVLHLLPDNELVIEDGAIVDPAR